MMESNNTLRSKQLKEAQERLRLFGLPERVQQAFAASGSVLCSDNGTLREPRPDELEIMEEFSSMTPDALLLHIIRGPLPMLGDNSLGILFVSGFEADWAYEKMMVARGNPAAYIHNFDYPHDSETGFMAIQRKGEGIGFI